MNRGNVAHNGLQSLVGCNIARLQKVVVWCNIAVPYECDDDPAARFPREFIDANQPLVRLVGPEGTTNPWTKQFPTMTGSGQYVMRWAVPSGTPSGFDDTGFDVCIRQLDGMELFQIAGFDLSYVHGAIPDNDLLSSMAGNAFSAFAVGACMVAVFSQLTIGTEEDDTNEVLSEAESVDPEG
jgi:hypothetical protein